jgi:hypothetical protein
MLAGCAKVADLMEADLPSAEPPAVSANPAHDECKVEYDKAVVAAQGDADAKSARRHYWGCLREKSEVYTAAKRPPP